MIKTLKKKEYKREGRNLKVKRFALVVLYSVFMKLERTYASVGPDSAVFDGFVLNLLDTTIHS